MSSSTSRFTRNPLRLLRRQAPFLAIFSLGLAILFWHLLARWGGIPAFMLPSPAAVWLSFMAALRNGLLLRNSLVTLG